MLAFQRVSLRMTSYFRSVNRAVNGRNRTWSPNIEKKYERYLRRIHKVCAHRSLFVTEKGYIGLGPWNSKKGDKVVVITGGHTPFLLREIPGKDGYRLVGESYVSGLMGGEALALAGKGNVTLKIF
jgi:hypothetical protein